MHIQVNTDRNIIGRETLRNSIRNELKQTLARFADRITRLEVHISDQNSDKRGGDADIRCLIESRLEGRHPTVVTHDAGNIKHAFSGAVNKLTRQLNNTLGRLNPRS